MHRTRAWLLGLLLLAGCGGDGIAGRFAAPPLDLGDLVEGTRRAVQEIKVSELRVELASREAPILIDVREAEEFDEGSIEGAVNIPRGVLEFRIADAEFWDLWGLDQPTKQEPIVLYGGREHRGAFAAESLGKLGYRRVMALAGGWDAWAAGKDELEPVVKKKKLVGCD